MWYMCLFFFKFVNCLKNLLLTNIYNYEKTFPHNVVIGNNSTIYCTFAEPGC